MILCCGEALIDMLPVSERPDRPAWSAHPGGAVFNTAVALGRQGAPTGLLTGLSSDLFGDMLRAELDAARVDHSLSDTSDRKTALAFVALSDGQARYSFHDVGSAHRHFAHNTPIPPAVTALFFGGISLASEPCGAALEALLDRERTGRMVMLDPNVRPAFIEDEAAYRRRLARLIGRADIVKVSDEDLGWLSQDRGSLDDQIVGILAQGPSVVLVTQGVKGALAVTKTGLRIAVGARKVKVVDTVGAGDTFNAGFLASLEKRGLLSAEKVAALSENDLRAATAHAIAAAAIVVGRAGANPPWQDEMIA